MPFKVKGTVIAFLGDEEKYPCHFSHKVGDEVIFDGEKYIGRLCPDVWPMIAPKVANLHVAGPRYIEPAYYYPFWYCSCSLKDPSQKKYDGIGFKNVLKTYREPKYTLPHLVPPDAFKWPPHTERNIAKDAMVICPDFRSAMLMKLEAFDLSDKGFDVPYFRRQMAILSKVLRKGEVGAAKILSEFSKREIEEIYPPLSPMMVQVLVEELELMKYLKIDKDKAHVTKKGEAKLKEFKASLTAREKEALKM